MRLTRNTVSQFLIACLATLMLVVTVSTLQALGLLTPDGHTAMAVGILGTGVLTIVDWAKRLEPDGGVTTDIVEMLSVTNEILIDMLWLQGNLATGHRTTLRTALPTVYVRLLNQGVTPSKSTTVQVDEATAKFEAWSEVDKALADMEGDTNAFRFSEALAFIEAMNQSMSTSLFYGNGSTTIGAFTGLSPRYAAISGATNKQNVLNAQGAASVNSSIWLILWGRNTFHGIFPRGTQAGLQHHDHGEETAETSATLGGTRLRVYRDQFVWDAGVCLRDWRYCVRIANIDTTNLIAESQAANIIKYMIKAIHKIPSFGLGRASFYMNRTVFEMLDIQRFEAVQTGGQLHYSEVDGVMTPMFRGIPIRRSDALLNTEATIS